MAKFDDYKDIWVFVEQRNGKFINVAMELLDEANYEIGRASCRERV